MSTPQEKLYVFLFGSPLADQLSSKNRHPLSTAMQTLPKERRYETLSYLPPLSDAQIAKQVQYILSQGYIPAVEFNETSEPTELFWTMWKLPLFGAKSTQEVLNEVQSCRSQYSNCYIRVVGFDNIKQCQVLSFIVHKPSRY